MSSSSTSTEYTKLDLIIENPTNILPTYFSVEYDYHNVNGGHIDNPPTHHESGAASARVLPLDGSNRRKYNLDLNEPPKIDESNDSEAKSGVIVPKIVVEPDEEVESSRKRLRKRPVTGKNGKRPITGKNGKRPKLQLPEGWEIERRKRKNGASVGHVDKYYIEPGTGSKFRSLVEVDEYKTTGKRRDSRKRKESSRGLATPTSPRFCLINKISVNDYRVLDTAMNLRSTNNTQAGGELPRDERTFDGNVESWSVLWSRVFGGLPPNLVWP